MLPPTPSARNAAADSVGSGCLLLSVCCLLISSLTLPPVSRKKPEVLTPFRGVPVMKRLIALVALLCAASACTTTTENANTGAGNNNNANAAATATPVAAGPTQADIEAKERQVWDALKAKNWDAFAGLMSEDFVIVGANGVQTRAQMM